jgi:hypothetical protein
VTTEEKIKVRTKSRAVIAAAVALAVALIVIAILITIYCPPGQEWMISANWILGGIWLLVVVALFMRKNAQKNRHHDHDAADSRGRCVGVGHRQLKLGRAAHKAGGEVVDDSETEGEWEVFEFDLPPDAVRDLAEMVLGKRKGVKTIKVTGPNEVTSPSSGVHGL